MTSATLLVKRVPNGSLAARAKKVTSYIIVSPYGDYLTNDPQNLIGRIWDTSVCMLRAKVFNTAGQCVRFLEQFPEGYAEKCVVIARPENCVCKNCSGSKVRKGL